jgi:hypothetical protein
MNKKKSSLLIFLLILFTIPSFFYLLRPGLPATQDGEDYLIRLAAFHRCLRDFQIPPRFAGQLNYTYGYPIFNFLYPLFYYIGEIFYLAGFSLILSAKSLLILSFIFSSFFMYIFSREFFPKIPSVLASIFYVYAPYRFTDVYIRGSFGEAIAFVFIPLIFWSISRIFKTSQKKYIATGGFSLAALIMSHNVIAFIFSPIIIVFICFCLYKQRKTKFLFQSLKHSISLLTLSLGLSCFFWLPAILEIKYTVFSQTHVSTFFDYFPKLTHLFLPIFKNLPKAPGFGEINPLQVGPIHTMIIILSLIFILKKKKQEWPLFFLTILLISFFLMNPISTNLWKIKSIHQFVQFPWRLLSVVCFTASFLSAFVLSQIKTKNRQILILSILIPLIIFTNKDNLRPKDYLLRDDNFYFTNDSTTVTQNEYLPRWVKNPPSKAPPKKIETQAQYQIAKQKSNLLEFTILTKGPTSVVINTVYYPGWDLFINNQKKAINYEKSGLIEFNLPQGESKITLKFKETYLRLFSDIITLISFLFLICLLLPKTSNPIPPHFKYAKN